MPVNTVTYNIFIASPSDLDEERLAFFDEVCNYNTDVISHRGVRFEIKGLEQLTSQYGRPQTIINQKQLSQSDYFLLVLWERWGSSPDVDSDGYSSGCEEEFSIAMQLKESSKISDISVFFKKVDEEKLNNPDEQLEKVLVFKRKLEAKKLLLYNEFNDIDQFRRLVRRKLSDWLRRHEERTKEEIEKDVTGLANPTEM